MSDLLSDISFILPRPVSLVGTDSSITQELKTTTHIKNRVHASAERLVLYLSKERDAHKIASSGGTTPRFDQADIGVGARAQEVFWRARYRNAGAGAVQRGLG